jgi:hypothetical protein
VKLSCWFTIITLNSYISTVCLLTALTFSGNWLLYRVFCDRYPQLYKHFALILFFFPSIIFWGSGLSKDSIAFAAMGWFMNGFYFGFIKRANIYANIIIIIISSIILYKIKVYVLLTLIFCSLIWITYEFSIYIKRKHALSKPLMVALIFGTCILMTGSVIILLNYINHTQYTFDNLIYKAFITQEDLKRPHYQGSSFDIGYYEPSPWGIIKKAHIAIPSGLFRPFAWESNNTLMFLSGLENLLLLILTFVVLFKSRVLLFVKLIYNDPFLLFCFCFSLVFAFSLGIAVSNFGALVRYKIPFLPFYLALLAIVYDKVNLRRENIS